MNARQKAKHYKKKYEELAYMKIPHFEVCEDGTIDTIRFERCYPVALISNPNTNIRQILVKDLAYELARNFDAYTKFTSTFLPHSNQWKFTADVRVVKGGN